jgi:hypothetical protein
MAISFVQQGGIDGSSRDQVTIGHLHVVLAHASTHSNTLFCSALPQHIQPPEEVLALLGRLLPAVVRPPLIKLEGHEIERLKQVVCGRRALPRSPKRVCRQ